MERLPAAEEVPDPAIGTGRMERRLTQEDLRKLSHHLGSGESRRKIRYVARQQSHLRRSSYFCPELVSAYIRKASQVPFYVPPSDRPLLYAIRASTIDPIAQPGELRREIPYVARQESHLRLSLYLHRGPVSAYISKASQVPFYVPPSDRPLLYAVRESTINPIAQPGLLRLPLELRQKIYGYLLPYNDKRIFQTRDRDRHRDGEIPNFAVKCARDADGRPVYMWGRCGGYEPLKAHTAIMRINKQLHNETQTYLFRGCTIKIHVDEVGYSFLEHDYGGPFVQQRLDSDGNNLLNYRGRDRYTKWYQTFVSNFDFTQLKKLIISIEAPQYDNPEGVVQIRWSMMALCDILRKCSKIQHIEVEPQSMEYRYSYYNHRCLRGSYFMWEWDKNVLPTFQSLWQHRPRFQGEAIWEGRLSHLVFDKVPDLALVCRFFDIALFLG